jgi:hypothetical protein
MTVPQVKKMCDFFAVDRTHQTSKEALIERLMDFLGKPDESYTKAGNKPEADKKKKKSSKKEVSEEEEEDDDEEAHDDHDEEDAKDASPVKEKKSSKKKEHKGPSDAQLRQWVKAYTHVFVTDKQDIKHAMDLAHEKFGSDMTDHKARIKEFMESEKK